MKTPVKKIKSLPPEKLSHRCNLDQLLFTLSTELEDLTGFVGQDRAIEALNFGIGIKQKGYNLYVLGPSGIGKHSVVRQFLTQEASKRSVPMDWCYIYNFMDPYKPVAMSLPAGIGIQLRKDMDELVEDLITSIPAIFDSEEYHTRIRKVGDEFLKKQEAGFKLLEEQARGNELLIASTAHGFTVAATRNGETISEEDFARLPEKERLQKEAALAKITDRLKEFVKEIPRLQKERRKLETQIQKEFALFLVEHSIDELRVKYKDIIPVITYLDAVQKDMVENVKDFLTQHEVPGRVVNINKPSLSRYKINLLVDNSQMQGAPVVYEDNPSYSNLMGQTENMAQMGALVTDFTLIKPGALHRANGGYLIIDVLKVFTQPFAWEGLKRALYARKATIELPTQLQSYISTVSLQPQPIPLDLKVVLIGDRIYYYTLCELDPDFMELFKVAADFEEHIHNDETNLKNYARLLATIIKNEGLFPFHRDAIARVIEHSARLVSDAEKLSLHIRSISDVLRESNYWAHLNGADVVQAAHVQQAIDHQLFRVNRIQQTVYEEIQRKLIFIETQGAKIGQVNALSVIDMGNFNFGYPTRITAVARVGKGEIINIEREVDLSGPLHSKSVFIISGYLSNWYAKDLPLSLTATLAFEQTYGEIEGDSASVAELCALISALAQIPIKQSLAVTGSINQHGEVQPVGGINEKIEGFFDICKQRGLNNEQGVLIPAANIKNLMLKNEIVQAVAQNKFHIYPITTVDEAVAIMTGIAAGERSKKGHFPLKTVNYLVENALQNFAKQARKG